MEVSRTAAGEGLARSGSTQHLDFYESMIHFKTMFPTIEEEIIEAVLRANNGAVDATVDQLLNMSSDCTGSSERDLMDSPDDESDTVDDVTEGAVAPDDFFVINVIAPSPPKAAKPVGQEACPRGQPHCPGSSKSPHSSSDGGQPLSANHVSGQSFSANQVDGQSFSANRIAEDDMTEPKRPLRDRSHAHTYINTGNQFPAEPPAVAPPIPEKPEYLRNKPNLMDASITDLVNLGANAPNPAATTIPMDSLTVEQGEDTSVTPTNLGIVEVIPDAPVAHDPRKVKVSEHGKRPRSMSVPIFEHSHLSPVSLYKKFRPVMTGDLPDDFLRLGLGPDRRGTTQHSGKTAPFPRRDVTDHSNAHPRYHQRSFSEQGHKLHYMTSQPRHHHRALSGRMEPPAVSREWIADKLAENERRRGEMSELGDAEAVRLLEDEHLALMLQNEEFLCELRRDQEFMSTLQLDQKRVTAKEHRFVPQPTVPRPAVPQPTVPQPSVPSSGLSEPDLEPQAPKPSEMQGYGEDGEEPLSTYLERDAPWAGRASSRDDNLELRQQLAHMGTTSKSRFLDIARRFFSRKKKTPSKPLYSQAHTPSTVNLLLEEETPECDVFDAARPEAQQTFEEVAMLPSSSASGQRPVTRRDWHGMRHHDNDSHANAVC